MISIKRTLVHSGLALLAAVALTGCNTGYSAYINNDTSQPLSAKLIDVDGQRVLSNATIGPSDKAVLGASEIPEKNAVLLEVDTLGNPGHPPTMRLLPGRTVVRIVEETQQSTRSKLRIEIVPN